MKKTITLKEYILSELKNNYPYSLFLSENENQITFYDYENMLHSKIILFSTEVKEICNKYIFSGCDIFLDNETLEKLERIFITYFIDRRIKYQTIEQFKYRLFSYITLNSKIIENVFNADNFILQKSKNKGVSDNFTINKHTNAYQDLPQNEVMIDLNIESLNYATNFTIDKNKSDGKNIQNNESQTYNIDNLIKSKEMLHKILTDLDILLFSQLH